MGEFERARALIRALTATTPSPEVMVPNGDDAAVLRVREDVVVTTDALVEHVDFAEWAPWDAVGRKALAVNLSDLAAMGAKPLGYLVTLVLPSGVDDCALEQLARGLAAMAQEAGMGCVGGDLSATRGPVVISITALGTVPPGLALCRTGAREGHGIYVSGTLGAAAAGLSVLRAEGAPALSLDEQLGRFSVASIRDAVRRQLSPEPRVRLGRALRGTASACIDVSDGLAQDLCHLLVSSGVGARLDDDAVPVHEGVGAAQARKMALAGGEDFELLFTSDNDKRVQTAAQEAETRVTRIGTVQRRGLQLRDLALDADDVSRLDLGLAPSDVRAAFLRGYVHPTQGQAPPWPPCCGS
jgi:thiamine-monophosphate kinase